MTQHRRPTIRFSDAPRGTCRWCGEPILHDSGEKIGEPNRRRRWHPACVDVYNQSDPREARRLVRKRDRGRCAECRVDTHKIRREVAGRGRAKKLRSLGYKIRGSLWELDHVVPLIDGGSHELSNLQTLCTPCHKKKTAEEARCRAQRRQAEAEAAADDDLLAKADAALARSESLLDALTPPRAEI
jgi:5-methylcytosine-specific restriction endonuclease McrA